jgi:tRNA-specific 2-thiouridylase
MARVVVAMSGGVDSSVTAWLLAQQGHEVIGLFMRHGVELGPVAPVGDSCRSRTCCSAADAADARRVADQIGIPFYAINFSNQFSQLVDYFVDEYLQGRTPNPCIRCNSWLKFGELFRYADSLGAEFVATGHYARIVRDDPSGTPALLRGIDSEKDQSYVLFEIDRERLGRILLPLGELTKSQVRQIAQQAGLRVAEKWESQEICFVGENGHGELVRRLRPDRNTSGPILTLDGTPVGWHSGIENFTVGQRKGLGVALGKRFYVVRIDPATNTVVIGPREALANYGLLADGANWLIDPPEKPFVCQVKIRYRSPAVPATVIPIGEKAFQVRFHQAGYAITPGQAAVCYDGDRVLGGGWIRSVLENESSPQ